ncbi:PDZ domain-containing protein [Botrimarina hoheduenensis]|uniref:PDZ domain-containing protein n=1 Tax=Botrimarina hoheduenensis TaxID=2528000 RepID=UPI0018D275E9
MAPLRGVEAAELVEPGVAAPADAEPAAERLVPVGPTADADSSVDAADAPARRFRNRPRRLLRPGFIEPSEPTLPVEGETRVGRYWIGVAATPTPPEVLAQLDLGDAPGLLVREVTPESPAAAAGVAPWDILTHVNNKPIASVAQLADAVGEAGENKAQLVLELLRKGRPQTVFLKPVLQAIAPPSAPMVGPQPGDAARGRLRQWLSQRLADPNLFAEGGLDRLLQEQLAELDQQDPRLGAGEAPPFVPPNLPGELPAALPSGVSVSITQSNNGPAEVTVRRTNPNGPADEWRFDADDEAALAELPDDVRPMVQRLLSRQGAPQAWILPNGDPMAGDVQQRLQQMEAQLDRFRQQMPGDPLEGAPRLFGVPPQPQAFQPQDPELQAPELQAIVPEVIAPLQAVPTPADQPEAAAEGPTELVVPAE